MLAKEIAAIKLMEKLRRMEPGGEARRWQLGKDSLGRWKCNGDYFISFEVQTNMSQKKVGIINKICSFTPSIANKSFLE